MRTIYLAGDSTAAQKTPDVAPETGWGMALPIFLSGEFTVDNRATNGRSSMSFIDEGRLAAILEAIQPDDILLIQFGHNDQKIEDPTRYCEPWTAYQEYLRQYIEGARVRGALPVLATPVERRNFDSTGAIVTTHGDYPAAMQALAEAAGVALLDIQALSAELWQKLGVEETKRYFLWTGTQQDDTHFSPPGAIEVARLVAAELVARGILAEEQTYRLDDGLPALELTLKATAGSVEVNNWPGG